VVPDSNSQETPDLSIQSFCFVVSRAWEDYQGCLGDTLPYPRAEPPDFAVQIGASHGSGQLPSLKPKFLLMTSLSENLNFFIKHLNTAIGNLFHFPSELFDFCLRDYHAAPSTPLPHALIERLIERATHRLGDPERSSPLQRACITFLSSYLPN
jgi:hypothetical protein